MCPSYEDAQITVYVTVTDLDDGTKLYYNFTIHVMVYSSYDTSQSHNKFFWVIPNPLGPPLDSSVVPFVVTMATLVAIALIVSFFAIPAAARKLDSYTSGNDDRRIRNILAVAIVVSVFMVALGPALGILGAERGV